MEVTCKDNKQGILSVITMRSGLQIEHYLILNDKTSRETLSTDRTEKRGRNNPSSCRLVSLAGDSLLQNALQIHLLFISYEAEKARQT